MDFDLNEEQQILTNMMERFVRDRYSNGERALYLRYSQGFCQQGWKILSDNGILALPFSAAFGGLGGRAEEIACIMRALGSGLAVEPYLTGPIIAGRMLEQAGSEAQKLRWLPQVIDGQAHIALAHIEKAARFNLTSLQTYFKNTKQMTLSGEKSLVLGANADVFIVSAYPDGAQGKTSTQKMKFFLVEKDARGLEQKNYRLVDGSPACKLLLHDVVGEPLPGTYKNFQAIIGCAKLAICAELLGIMEFLFEQTLDYLRTRKQFGQSLGSFQAIQHRMADLYANLELSRSHLFRAIAADGEADFLQVTSGTKAYIAAEAIKLAEECVQFHGAMGTTDELMIGHGLKRITLLATLFGDVQSELKQYVA